MSKTCRERLLIGGLVLMGVIALGGSLMARQELSRDMVILASSVVGALAGALHGRTNEPAERARAEAKREIDALFGEKEDTEHHG